MADISQTNEETDSGSSPAKSKWPKRLFIVFLILALALWLINGAGARWLIKDQLARVAEQQGLDGDAEISGSLHQGFTIQNASYKGEKGVQILEIKNASVSYTLSDIIRKKKIDAITISGATLQVDTAKFLPSTEEKKDEETDIKTSLNKLRKWITQPAIHFRDIDITILDDTELKFAFQLGALDHPQAAESFAITSFSAQDSEGRKTPHQNIQVQWLEHSLTIDRCELLPNIIIADTSLDWKDELSAATKIQIHDAIIEASISETIYLQLSQGNLNSSELEDSLRLNIPAQFKINGFETTITNWREPFPLWNINAKLSALEANYQKYNLTESTIHLTQQDQQYALSTDTKLSNSPLSAEIKGSWDNPSSQTWWQHTKARFQLSSNSLGEIPGLWLKDAKKVSLTESDLKMEGELHFDKTLLSASLQSTLSGARVASEALPPLRLTALVENDNASLIASFPPEENRTFEIEANYQLKEKTYVAKLNVLESELSWINSLLAAFDSAATLSGNLDLSWSGKGNVLEKTSHTGSLNINELALNIPDSPRLDIQCQARYTLPQSVNIDALYIQESEWNCTTSVIWDGVNIMIPALIFKNEKEAVLGGSAMIPFTQDTFNAQAFFAQTKPWNLSLKTQPLAFEQLEQWLKFKLPEEITGKNDLYIELTGSPSAPQAKGFINFNNVDGLNARQNGFINAHFDFQSQEDQLHIISNIKEGTTDRLNSNGLFPFTPKQWIDEPGKFKQSLLSSPISGRVNIKSFPLAKLDSYVPQLEKIQGDISGEGTFSGSFDDPIYDFDITVKAPLIKLTESSVGEIRNVELKTNITQDLSFESRLTAQINGGNFELQGSVDINDFEKPVFDLTLDTQYALIYRDDLLSTRANANLTLAGTIDDALLSGRIGIVESLIYKDIELIPIGVPSSEVAKVQLPSISKTNKEGGYPIPAPFNDWNLDLTLLAEDPILIRGNLAKGHIEGKLKVKGTLAKPEPDGTLYGKNIQARLPFSILAVDNGEITFTPENGFNPNLKVVGKSSIGSYDINVFVYGSTDSPQTSLTSSPPLPESEIMSLLATGSTTSNLANSNVAAFKAFQLFLIKMKQRQQTASGNQLFQTMLSSIENFNVSVGEVNQFTGKKFTSASIDLSKNWNLTAQVYDSEQTRGLIVYVIKFR
ncbi:MAG: translocation/assembly module TamB domain-containing protein [Akkermansiaceae bacterium]